MLGPIWHSDLGAIYHVIVDSNNLATSHDFGSPKILLVGDGKSLHIFHISSNSYSSHINNHMTLEFRNILLVSHIAKNLLSVTKFV